MKLRGKSIDSPKNTQRRPLGLPTILVAGMGTTPKVLTETECKHRKI